MKHLNTIAFILFCFTILAASIRGTPGNLTERTMNSIEWTDEGPLELSPERGRFALMYSVVENKSPFFSVPVARLALPDLGFYREKYVSLFAPGLSFLVAPGYIVGKLFGASQVGAFAIIAVFALVNAILISKISIRLGAHRAASFLGSIAFLFGSPAFSYAVTLYQHHVTTFLLLMSVYLLMRFKGLIPLFFVWFLIAVSIPLDYPNLIILLPIGIYAMNRIAFLEPSKRKLSFIIRPKGLLTIFGIIPPLMFFMWFNQISYGNPFQLSGTVPSVKVIDSAGLPSEPVTYEPNSISTESVKPKSKKSVLHFFNPRRLIDGLIIQTWSIDRGILVFSPVMILGVIGLFSALHGSSGITISLLASMGFTILLYAMWGDPWGGWAFGSRYLIPVYSILSVGIAVTLTNWRRYLLGLVMFLLVLIYSISIGTLGALTSNRNPPSSEIAALSKISGRNEEYSYDRNINYLKANKSKSFVYQTLGRHMVSASTYYWIVFSFITAGSIILTGALYHKHEK